MKKIILVLLCAAGFGLTASAQCSGHKSTEAATAPAKNVSYSGASKSSTTCQSSKASSTAQTGIEAALAADKTVEKRVCATSGNVSYVRRVSANGQVTHEDVVFDEATNTFVPKTKSCNKAGAPGCCSKPGSKTTSAEPRNVNSRT